MRSYPKSPIWIPLNLPTSHQLYLDDVVRILTRSLQAGGTRKKLQLIVPWLKTAESIHVVEGWSYHTHGCDYSVGGYSQSKRPNEPQSIVGIIGGIMSRPFKYISAKRLVLIFLYSVKVHVKESMHNACSLALDQSKTNSC